MFCSNCRTQLADGTPVCPACGAAQAVAPAPGVPGNATIPNHMVGAILATLFCCLPFGIVAIVNASSVNGKLAMGDIAGAQAASQKAQKWITASVICGIIILVLNLLVNVLPAIANS